MIDHEKFTNRQLRAFIKKKKVTLAGNRRLKIFGTLACASGKRMKKVNRVFFSDEAEAIELGFRPCGHCLRSAYSRWKISKN